MNYKDVKMTQSKAAQLVDLLQQELTWLDSLIALLSEEKNVLIQRQFDALESLAEQKQALSEQLEQSAKQRIELLAMNLHDNQPKLALQALLRACSVEEANQIQQLNNQLAEKLLSCHELNAVNGQVITSNLNTRQEILGALTGKNQVNATNLYTANGDVQSTTATSRHQEA